MKMRRGKSSGGTPSASSKDEKVMAPSSISPEPNMDSPGKTPQSEGAGGSGTETEPKPEEEKTGESSKTNVLHVGTGSASIQEMLAELYRLVKDTHKGKERSEANLGLITKTQESINQSQKISPYYRTKLRSLYQSALSDAENEAELYRKSLEKITEIKNIRNEQRLQARSAGHHSDSDGPRKIMRRGVLMNMLQQTAITLPLWIGRTEQEKPPPLCGAIPAESSYISKPGDYIAARVRGSDGDENWILAEVISFNSGTNKYEVDDIDEEGKERHLLSRRRIVPLPLMKANPETNPEALFKKGMLVMALYPQTTCFYRALVERPPEGPIDDYSVLFEDNSYADGYSPALNVAQRYVVQVKEPRKR
nr:SAGA-associated factor 29-like [Lytechinus pictus]